MNCFHGVDTSFCEVRGIFWFAVQRERERVCDTNISLVLWSCMLLSGLKNEALWMPIAVKTKTKKSNVFLGISWWSAKRWKKIKKEISWIKNGKAQVRSLKITQRRNTLTLRFLPSSIKWSMKFTRDAVLENYREQCNYTVLALVFNWSVEANQFQA